MGVSTSNRRVWRLVPSATLSFFLDIPGDVALQRKNDIPVPEYIFQRIALYQQVCVGLAMTRLDGCWDADFIHQQIVSQVGSNLCQRAILKTMKAKLVILGIDGMDPKCLRLSRLNFQILPN